MGAEAAKDFVVEPAFVTEFECRSALGRQYVLRKASSRGRSLLEVRRQLEQDRPQLFAEHGRDVEKVVDVLLGVFEPPDHA